MIQVRKANKNDLETIVNIHLERFSSFFLTTLGAAFLKVFYKAFLKNPGILLVLEDEGKVQGFAAGSISNQGFFKKLLFNNFIEFGFIGVRILFTKPAAIKRIATNANKAEKNNFIFAELLSIATARNKKGYGKILLEAFEREIIKNNNDNLPISLTTDFDDNEKAVSFYKEAGYEIFEIFESYQKRKMIRFIKKTN